MSKIKHVAFDFDGTCTQIPPIWQAFTEEYRNSFFAAVLPVVVTSQDWAEAEQDVKKNSPAAGWMVGGTPSAPIAADPYIMADEVSRLICRQKNIAHAMPPGLFSTAYDSHPAPWREEALDVLTTLHKRGITIHFVSNSSPRTIASRLDELLGADSEIRVAIRIASGAGKFLIQELPWDKPDIVSAEMRSKFGALPASDKKSKGRSLKRPIYLRRGSYFQALCATLNNSAEAYASTVVCGDVWELDLAMPAALGIRVHLIERAAPFRTYPYEIQKIEQHRAIAEFGPDLTSLIDRC